MTDNEIISRARGECRHKWKGKYSRKTCSKCGKVAYLNRIIRGVFSAPRYDSDPAAWTPELYEFIEERGLAGKFTEELDFIIAAGISDGRISAHFLFSLLSSTPEQKARALARAIEEQQ